MSIEHLNAAFNCKHFKGSVRNLLLALANRASDGSGKSKEQYGWSFAGLAQLMMDINAQDRGTVIDGMKALCEAGVVKRQRRMNSSTKSFVDIDALRKLAYTDEDKERVKRKVASKVGKNPTIETLQMSGKTLHSNVGKYPTTNVGKYQTCMVGKHPTYNPQVNHQVNPKSESKADSDSESVSETLEQEEPKDLKSFNQNNLKSVQEPVMQEFDDPVNLYPTGMNKSILAQASRVDHPVSTKVLPATTKEVAPLVQDASLVSHGGFAAEPPEVAPAPPKEIKDTVYLCSLWWATHPKPKEGMDPNNLAHPRYWEPWKRREAFLEAFYDEDEDDFVIHLPDPEPDKEDEVTRLHDEEIMLALYHEHGRATIEEVIRWLPCSDHWFAKLNNLSKFKAAWKLISDQFDKYLAKAMESETDDSCQEWIGDKFAEAGGNRARLIFHERMHPALPIDSQDAAEEQAMDAYDDEYGDDFFYLWAVEDYEAAITALKAKKVGEPYDAIALRVVDWSGYDNIRPYEGVEFSIASPGDSATPPRLEVTEWTL